MVKFVVTFALKPGVDPAEAYKYWVEVHVPNVKRAFKGLRKYVIDRAIEGPGPRDEPQGFFGMAQLWFDDIDTARKALPKGPPIDDFHSYFCDFRRAFAVEREIEL